MGHQHNDNSYPWMINKSAYPSVRVKGKTTPFYMMTTHDEVSISQGNNIVTLNASAARGLARELIAAYGMPEPIERDDRWDDDGE